MSGFSIDYNINGLKSLEKILKESRFYTKLGVLGDAQRSEADNMQDPPTNALIGLWHEFGTSKMTARSFLRMPLNMKMQKYLEDSGAFETEAIEKLIDAKSIEGFFIQLGAVGQTIIIDAFDSGGFGEWDASDMRYKKVHQTLVETQQLRDSISSEVVEGD